MQPLHVCDAINQNQTSIFHLVSETVVYLCALSVPKSEATNQLLIYKFICMKDSLETGTTMKQQHWWSITGLIIEGHLVDVLQQHHVCDPEVFGCHSAVVQAKCVKQGHVLSVTQPHSSASAHGQILTWTLQVQHLGGDRWNMMDMTHIQNMISLCWKEMEERNMELVAPKLLSAQLLNWYSADFTLCFTSPQHQPPE